MERINKKKSIGRYWPLLVLILTAALAGAAVTHRIQGNFFSWMHFFMGFALCQFAMLKLFQPLEFVHGFQKYDLVAKKFPAYAYLYPIVELGLGLAYLSFAYPIVTYVITLLVMGLGVVGVIRALQQGLDVRCACMGTILDVPLSTVTLSEDIVMGAMALWMLFSSLS